MVRYQHFSKIRNVFLILFLFNKYNYLYFILIYTCSYFLFRKPFRFQRIRWNQIVRYHN